ncbi:Nucleoporin NDC1 [Dinochytrium kinnereticum]|nr:Nucleoporin NDC1 [Dinochytrium kinnereticum]
MLFSQMIPTPTVYANITDKKFLMHMTLFSFFVFTFWEIIDALYEAVIAEPVVLQPSAYAVQLICETLKQENSPLEKDLALYTIWKVARSNKQFRNIIFNDSNDGSAAQWPEILSECATIVTRFSDKLEDLLVKGKDTKKPVSLPKLVERHAALKIKSPKKVDLSKENVFSPRKDTGLMNNLLSPGKDQELRQRKLTEMGLKPIPDKRGSIPSLLRSSRDSDVITKAPEPIVAKKKKIDMSISGLMKFAQESLQSLFNKKKIDAIPVETLANKYFSDYQRVVWACQALAYFIVAATTEDRYGAVQKSVPAVLETLLRCLTLVEKYIARPPGLMPLNRRQIQLKKPTCVADNLRTSIYSVVTSLYDYLGRYEFDPKVAEKLQRFLDFRE